MVSFDFATEYVAVSNDNSAVSWAVQPRAGISGVSSLGSFIPRLDTLASIFARFRVKRLILEWTPMVASTQSGLVAFGYDPDSTIATPSGVVAVTRLSKHVVSDIKNKCRLVLNESDLTDMGLDTWFRCLVLNSATNTDTALQGNIRFWASHSGYTAGQSIGMVTVKADLAFKGYDV